MWSLFIGMERMTTPISGLVMAYDNEWEAFSCPWLEVIAVPLPEALART